MSNDDNKSNYDGQRSYILPGGLPDTKPVTVYKRPVRPPQLSNRDDIAAIVKTRQRSANIEAVCEELEGILFENAFVVQSVCSKQEDRATA